VTTLLRFVVLLATRAARFFHGQQLTIPAVFVAVNILLQVGNGTLSLRALQQDTWKTLFPWIVTTGIFSIYLVVSAARTLSHELAGAVEYKHLISLASGELAPVKKASQRPAAVMGLTFIIAILILEFVAFREAYPYRPPRSPTIQQAISLPQPKSIPPPKPHVQSAPPTALNPRVKLIFGEGPALNRRRRNISEVIDKFYVYLSDLTLEPPTEFPPLSDGPVLCPGIMVTMPGSILYSHVTIGWQCLDDRASIVTLYSSYAFGVMIPYADRYDSDNRYHMESALATYFAWSFLGKRKEGIHERWLGVLWAIRGAFGARFTDRSLAFAVQEMNIPHQPRARSLDQFFYWYITNEAPPQTDEVYSRSVAYRR
jgi:hypothetical protein